MMAVVQMEHVRGQAHGVLYQASGRAWQWAQGEGAMILRRASFLGEVSSLARLLYCAPLGCCSAAREEVVRCCGQRLTRRDVAVCLGQIANSIGLMMDGRPE